MVLVAASMKPETLFFGSQSLRLKDTLAAGRGLRKRIYFVSRQCGRAPEHLFEPLRRCYGVPA